MVYLKGSLGDSIWSAAFKTTLCSKEIKTVTLYCLSQIHTSLTKPRGSMDKSHLRKASMEATGQVMLCTDPVRMTASSSC